ncbi:MAG TPA: hypothetical protein VIO57_11105 [Chloroflexota bacterium]|jgi:hypothetical protein
MHTLETDRAGIDSGVFAFTTEFYTEHFVVHAKLSSPERRLSDHLNGSVASVDIRPVSALQLSTGVAAELGRTHAQITKARILFVVPIAEPDRPSGQSNAAWKATSKYGAWAGVGPYSISGTIHTDAGRDPQIALRLLDKQFLPFTAVTITFPDGETQRFPTIIVNRQYLDLLALEAGT